MSSGGKYDGDGSLPLSCQIQRPKPTHVGIFDKSTRLDSIQANHGGYLLDLLAYSSLIPSSQKKNIILEFKIYPKKIQS